MKRRNFIGLSAAMLGACASTSLPRSSETVRDVQTLQKPAVVLVHGAWHGGWCWKHVAAILRSAGFLVYTPTLTGLGERSHLRSPVPTLAMHIQDIVNVIDCNELDDFILLGHSYSGMVITGVADQKKDQIRHMVYLDAALPNHGDSMISQAPGSTPESVAATTQQLKAFAPDGVWMGVFPATVLGIPPEQLSNTEWVNRRLTPHPLQTWTDPVVLKNAGPENLARTYIHCTNPVMPGASFSAHAAKIRPRSDWRYRELATGHDAMITEPKLVAQEIMLISHLA